MSRQPRIERSGAVGYIRVSSAEQAREGWSLPDQRARIEGQCAARGWDLHHVYADEGVSATEHRPDFEQMVADVLADGVAYVVTSRMDRIGRSARDLLNFYDRLESAGVGLVLIDQGIDTSTSYGRLFRTILAGVAEFERDLSSERITAGLAQRKASGLPIGRKRVIVGELAERIVAMAAGGLTPTAIAAALTTEGVPTAMGGSRWWHTTIAKVLAAGAP